MIKVINVKFILLQASDDDDDDEGEEEDVCFVCYLMVLLTLDLRTVLPLASAHTFCASQYVHVFKEGTSSFKRCFCAIYDNT